MLTFLHSSQFSTPFNFLSFFIKPTFSESTTINSVSLTKPSKILIFSSNSILKTSPHVCFCYKNGVFDEILDTHLSEKPQSDKLDEIEELELRGKPSPLPNGSEFVEIEPVKPNEDEVLAPFLKFFKPRESLSQEEEVEELGELKQIAQKQNDQIFRESKRVLIEYYEPKPGDFVVGVVVSGNENKLDVNIGADLLGTMLTKEVLPLYDKELENLLCDVDRDAEEFFVRGKIGIVRNDDAINSGPVPGRPVVDTGTVLFAEVLGRTLSGRPLLSTRRFFRRIAWHRVRQIHQLNEPIEIIVTEWNTGGLLTRIEGLRAFLPKGELMNKVNNFTGLKENVGRRLQVQISRIDESTNDLILSEREAWEMLHLQIGTLLEGTVRKIFPYGAQIRIGESNRSGLLHISNITRSRIVSVSDLLAVNEKVKALVVKSMFPGKISLSIADLESEPGLFMSNKEKVFEEAEEMAKKFKQKLPSVLKTRTTDPLPVTIPFDNEEQLYANWNCIADLESEPGLFMSNKEKVFEEAEEMAKKFKQKLPSVLKTRTTDPLPVTIPFDNEEQLYANWNWFKFERDHSESNQLES